MTTAYLLNWITNRQQQIREKIMLADKKGEERESVKYNQMLVNYEWLKTRIKCYKEKKYCWQHLDWLLELEEKTHKFLIEYPKYILRPQTRACLEMYNEVLDKIRETPKRFNTIEIEEWFVEREYVKKHIELFYHEPQEHKPAIEALEYIEKYVINTREKEFNRVETIKALEEERPKHFNTGLCMYYLNDNRSIIANGIFDRVLFWLKYEAEGYK